MGYQVPTFDQMQSFVTGMFRSLLPTRNIGSRFAFYWKLVRVITAAVTDVHVHVDKSEDNVMPDTTSGGMLDRWLKIVGTSRKGATPARKSAAGRLVGVVASPFLLGQQLVHRATGMIFQLNQSGSIPAAGYIDVDIIGVSTGSVTRLNKKEILEFLSTPPGIKTNVELQLDLDEDGTDNEIDGAGQVRLLGLFGNPQAGGNQSDYVNWLLAILGVSCAFCYPNRAGVGTVDLAVLHSGTGTSRIFNDGERAAVLAAIQALAPTQLAGQGGALRVLKTVSEVANVEMLITTDGTVGSAWDWDDTQVPTVLAYTSLTRTLQFSGGSRPPTMKAGDRICIKGVSVPGSQSCAPVVIESLIGSDTVILQSDPTAPDGSVANPVAGDLVYSGGPLTQPIRDAVAAHINSDTLYTGPRYPIAGAFAASQGISTSKMNKLLLGVGTSNPGGIYGAWNGELTISALSTIAAYTTGVRKCNIITPVSDQGSTDYIFPLDLQIGVLTPGYVLIRRG